MWARVNGLGLSGHWDFYFFCNRDLASLIHCGIKNVPDVLVCITVAEVVHVPAVAIQATRTLLDPRQKSSPICSFHSVSIQPPRQRRSI